ncbi:LysR family transcriptional regulator [Kineobactrum salinum]|uniref:HTH-type transcriptional regulator MetR n=1 Tax=Kineobactrum salinum TaxID=2708301 RepID=A0A6C0U068_9GAMM|nr:LysR family transcriptional regulator [Kineobactrum salinum]QIB65308.1 LysR family transcriptional regulator [Kineobactrum salinum]
MIDRHHLAIVRAVDRQGTLTEAAASLHLTQSALSHAIKKLEQQMGAAIWQRDGRNLRLTPAGQQLLALANRLLPQFEYAETQIAQMAKGLRGELRIGMECHPCYQWLLTVVAPFFQAWPDVDVDVKQAFQFGGLAALFNHDIDLLVTPDPLYKPGLDFTPVFDYEQVLVLPANHPLSTRPWLAAEDVRDEILLSYPVEVERLDVFNHFFVPAGCSPRKHKMIETTDIMLQMVAAGRGIAALPDWLVANYAQTLPLCAISMGEEGVGKQIHLGRREADAGLDYLDAFVAMAAGTNEVPQRA